MLQQNGYNTPHQQDHGYIAAQAAASEAAKQRHDVTAVASSVPPDLPADAGTFLVALQPRLQPVTVQEGFTALQLPAEQLQAALAEAVLAGQQQQQQQQAQSLLPAPGACCMVDLQLIAVSLEAHPKGQEHGSVGCVQQLSNVIEGGAVLQALQDGSTYRYAVWPVCCDHLLGCVHNVIQHPG
jgi:hypothetical protein